jgi:DNA-binding transcriptional MocR family regulator
MKPTDIANRLNGDGIKKYAKFLTTPNMITLAGGLPMDDIMPFDSIDIHLRSVLENSDENDNNFTLINNESLKLNYTRGIGLADMHNWVANHIQTIHKPQCSVSTCVTTSSTSSLSKTLMLCDSETVVCDNYAFFTAIKTMEVLGKLPIGVAVDSEGMIPSELRQTVKKLRNRGKSVNLVYLTPVGQNPMGFAMSIARKHEIYEVCKELDLVIIEDGKSLFYVSDEFSVFWSRLSLVSCFFFLLSSTLLFLHHRCLLLFVL